MSKNNVALSRERERERERVSNSLSTQSIRGFFNYRFVKTAAILFCGGFLFMEFLLLPKYAHASNETLRPNGAGSETAIATQFPNSTFHWDKVDEAVTDDNTSFVTDTRASGSYRDLYSLSDHTGSGTINSVTVYARLNDARGSNSSGQISIRTNSTTYDTSAYALTTSWANKSNVWTLNPQTGLAWTWTNIDALEAGVTLQTSNASGGSILSGQLILMADGSQKNIEDIMVGDEVISFNLDSQKAEKDKVTDVMRGSHDDYLIFNGTLKASLNHVIWANGEYKPADNIKVGEFLTNSLGQVVEVASIEHIVEKVNTYDLTIEKNHNFFASNYLVHNGMTVQGQATQVYVVVDYTPSATTPTLTTSAASSVVATSVTGNGNVTADGGATVTDRGFYWVTDASSGSCTGASGGTQVTAGSGTGAYTGSIGSLTANTYYCYRSYATNSAGTGYGSWTSFQTAPTAPSLIHIVSNNASTTLAKSGNTVTVTATVDTGTTVTGNIGGKTTTTNTVSGTTATLTRLLDASETEGAGLDFTLVSTGGAGNSATAVTKTNVVDGSAVQTDFTTPAALGTPDMTAGTDLGSSSTDNITSNITPSFVVSCETGDTVTLYDNTTSVGTGACSASTVTIASSALSEGIHATMNAKQTDPAGNPSVASGNLSVTIDTTNPTSAISAPSDNSFASSTTVSGSSVTISADASDNVGVSGVQFKLDTNTLIGSEVTTAPYNITWNSNDVADGAHTLIAVVRDNSGNYATSTAVNITVSNTVVLVPPIVTISHRSSGQYSRRFIQPVQPPTISQSLPAPTFTRNFSPKSTSSDVKLLQIYLNTHDFVVANTGDGSAGHETNYFGSATKAALIKFQKANGILPATGDFGPRTRALLNGISATPTATSLTPTSPATQSLTADTSNSSFARDLEKGMTGNGVKQLQIYFNTNGFLVATSGAGSLGHETNYFGSATKAALIKFQKASGITPTSGYFGAKTMEYISTH